MKKRFSAKLFSALVLSISFFSVANAASPKDELNKRLAMNEGFSADFSQQVIS